MTVEITPEQSKRARRELGRSQKQVADAMGISRSKISWLESGKFMPESEFMKALRSYYERQGVQFGDEDAGDHPEPGEDEPGYDGRNSVHGFQEDRKRKQVGAVIRVDAHLSAGHVEALMDAIDVQDEHIENLLEASLDASKKPDGVLERLLYDRELSQSDKQRSQNLLLRLATSAMLMRVLQGKPVVPMASEALMESELEASTVGHLVSRDITDMARDSMSRRQWRKIEGAADADPDEEVEEEAIED